MTTMWFGYKLANNERYKTNLEAEEKISRAYTDFYNGISKREEVKPEAPIIPEAKKQEQEQADIFREWLLGEVEE